jgi:hypothetical protein
MHGLAFRIENSQLSSMALPYRPPLDMLNGSVISALETVINTL